MHHSFFSILLSLFLLPCISWAQNISEATVERTLKMLDNEIKKAPDYLEMRTLRIDSLQNLLSTNRSDSERLDILMDIGDNYSTFNTDSALIAYTQGYDMATDLGLKDTSIAFKLKRAKYLPLCGFIADAQNEFNAIDTTSLSLPMRKKYHDAGKQMYSYIASFYSDYPSTYQYWNEKSLEHARQGLLLENPQSTTYRLNSSEMLYLKGNLSQARAMLMELIDELPSDSNQYARASHMLATIAQMRDDMNSAKYFLALSAMADIKGAVLEVMSLQELGVIMSKEGDINRAYLYLSTALSNAVECHASMRTMQTSAALPIIQDAHAEQINQWQKKLYIFIGFLCVLLLLLAGVLFYLRRQMKRMQELQRRLSSANQVKEIYISQFFRLCSIYIDKLNHFCKIVNRKINSDQIDDLYKMTKSGKIVEQQSTEFYRLFDDAFLHIYPTFVDDVNKLLREKIILRDGELLNNDLRILAFMRLGLEDTNQVAQILNYSVNTIYAYRNKIRNRAYDRDNFEKKVMQISSI